jgi:hypothetical protein
VQDNLAGQSDTWNFVCNPSPHVNADNKSDRSDVAQDRDGRIEPEAVREGFEAVVVQAETRRTEGRDAVKDGAPQGVRLACLFENKIEARGSYRFYYKGERNNTAEKLVHPKGVRQRKHNVGDFRPRV